MSIDKNKIEQIEQICKEYQAHWIAVTKTQPIANLESLYAYGKREFGENKAQELCMKYEVLPKDIDWHFIGHLQTNKVKQIIDKVSTIHAVDSLKLLHEIQKEAAKIDKIVHVFIQIHVAKEETKYGFSVDEIGPFIEGLKFQNYPNIRILGLMAMASNTKDKEQIQGEFTLVKTTLNELNARYQLNLKELSMGMSGDYEIALALGATWIRLGSILYQKEVNDGTDL